MKLSIKRGTLFISVPQYGSDVHLDDGMLFISLGGTQEEVAEKLNELNGLVGLLPESRGQMIQAALEVQQADAAARAALDELMREAKATEMLEAQGRELAQSEIDKSLPPGEGEAVAPKGTVKV